MYPAGRARYQLFDRIEGLQLQQVFLQGSYEAFGDAVALGFTNEGGRSFVPQSNVMPPRSSSSRWVSPGSGCGTFCSFGRINPLYPYAFRKGN